MKIHRRSAITAGLFALIGIADVAAQQVSGPLKVVVPTAAGGPIDTAARLVFDKAFGRAAGGVVVENKPGANLQIGEGHVAKSAADGRTLVTTTIGHFINPVLYASMPYDPVKDLKPVFLLAHIDVLLVASGQLATSNMAELVAWGKANPDKMTFASGGNGSGGHLIATLITKAAGLPMHHVPYKSVATFLPDLMEGRVSFAIGTVQEMTPLIQSGKVKAIATTAPRRNPNLPGVPTLVEAGYPELKMSSWLAVFAPSATPEAVVMDTAERLGAALQTSEVSSALEKFGMRTEHMTLPQLRTFMNAENQLWSGAARAAGIKPE